MPTAKAMERLVSTAAKLNAASDDLNDAIQQLEQQLADAGVGITLWLEYVEDPDYGWLIEHEIYRSDEDDDKMLTAEGWQLGYAKIGSDWRIATRRVIAEGRAGEPQMVLSDGGGAIPLLKAPRTVRVQASELLEDLVDELAQKMERYVQSIRQAKAQVTGDE